MTEEVGAGVRVLLLEEDPIFARELREGLSAHGCDVVLLRHGQTGLARAVTDRFDVICVSAELPGVNGFRLCNRVKRDPNFGATPVVLMGDVESDSFGAHQALDTRADLYLRRPVALAELVAAVRGAVSRSGAPAEAAPASVVPGDPAALVSLRHELAVAHDALGALEELRTRLREQDAALAELAQELAVARADAVLAAGRAQEIARLERALEATKKRAPPLPLPSQIASNAREKLAEEERLRAAEEAVRDRDAVVLRLEGELARLRGEKQQESAANLAKLLAEERKSRQLEGASHKVALATVRSQAERNAVELAEERRKTAEAVLAERERADARIAALRAEAEQEAKVNARASGQRAEELADSTVQLELLRVSLERDLGDERLARERVEAQLRELEAVRARECRQVEELEALLVEARGQERETALGDALARARAEREAGLEAERAVAAGREQASVADAASRLAASHERHGTELARRDARERALAERLAREVSVRTDLESALARARSENARAVGAREAALRAQDGRLAEAVLRVEQEVALERERGERAAEELAAAHQVALEAAHAQGAELRELELARLREELAEQHAASLREQAGILDEERARARVRVDALESELAAARASVDTRARELQATSALARRVDHGLQIERESLTHARAERDAARREAEAAVSLARTEMDALRSALAEREAERASLVETSARASALEARAARAEASQIALERARDDAEGALAALASQAGAERQRMIRSEEELAACQSRVVELEYERALAAFTEPTPPEPTAVAGPGPAAPAVAASASGELRREARAALTGGEAAELEELRRTMVRVSEDMPALEAEIVVLRADLLSVRRRLEHELLAGAALEARMECDRAILSRARALLEESEDPNDPAGPGRE